MTRWSLRRAWARRTAPPALVPVLLPEPLQSEVRRLLAEAGEVAAVRRVRAQTGIGLLPAVLAVRAVGAD